MTSPLTAQSRLSRPRCPKKNQKQNFEVASMPPSILNVELQMGADGDAIVVPPTPTTTTPRAAGEAVWWMCERWWKSGTFPMLRVMPEASLASPVRRGGTGLISSYSAPYGWDIGEIQGLKVECVKKPWAKTGLMADPHWSPLKSQPVSLSAVLIFIDVEELCDYDELGCKNEHELISHVLFTQDWAFEVLFARTGHTLH